MNLNSDTIKNISNEENKTLITLTIKSIRHKSLIRGTNPQIKIENKSNYYLTLPDIFYLKQLRVHTL